MTIIPLVVPIPVTQDLLDVLTYTTGVEENDTSFRSGFPFVQLPWDGTGKCSGGAVAYTQPEVLAPTPFVEQVCALENFAPQAFSVFLKGIPGVPGDTYSFDSNGGTLTTFDNGTANLQGVIQMNADTTYQWQVDVWLINKRDWAAWSALGRSYKGGRQVAINNHMNWDFYEIDNSRATLTGLPGSAFAGESIVLAHMPSNFNYGFQIGLGANDKNGNFGASAWFTFSGSYSGHGDFNVTTSCGPLMPVVMAKVMLQGAYDPATQLMRNQLNSLNTLPLLQPYGQGGYAYQAFEAVREIPSPEVVDWVLVQLRDAQDPTIVLSERGGICYPPGRPHGPRWQTWHLYGSRQCNCFSHCNLPPQPPRCDEC